MPQTKIYQCASCDYETDDSPLFDGLSSRDSRAESDDLMGAGECPECGAIVFDTTGHNYRAIERSSKWQVLYVTCEGKIAANGPFDTEEDAMQHVAERRYKLDCDNYDYELKDEYVYLQGPDRCLQLLSDSDFDETTEADNDVAQYLRDEEMSENGQDD